MYLLTRLSIASSNNRNSFFFVWWRWWKKGERSQNNTKIPIEIQILQRCHTYFRISSHIFSLFFSSTSTLLYCCLSSSQQLTTTIKRPTLANFFLQVFLPSFHSSFNNSSQIIENNSLRLCFVRFLTKVNLKIIFHPCFFHVMMLWRSQEMLIWFGKLLKNNFRYEMWIWVGVSLLEYLIFSFFIFFRLFLRVGETPQSLHNISGKTWRWFWWLFIFTVDIKWAYCCWIFFG